jgi:pilus assembly protein CpaB
MQRQLANPYTALQGSSKFGLLLALALAVGAGIVIFLIAQQDEDAGASVGSAQTAQILLAGSDIPAGTQITASMLRIEPVPLTAVHDQAAASEDLGLLVGQTARYNIRQGQQILTTNVISPALVTATDALAFVVPEGQRALGIRVDRVIGAGGLVRPGDRVDVFAVVDIERIDLFTGELTGGAAEPVIVAQNLEVLAVEQELIRVLPTQGNEERTAENGGLLPDQAAAQPASTVVTLAVSPDEGRALLFAEDGGQIRLAVRAPGDNTIVSTETLSYNINDLLEARTAVAQRANNVPLNEDTSLAFIVPVGYRAMAVSVDKVIGAGGLIRPGDFVDVLAVIEVTVAIADVGLTEGMSRGITLVQDVEVLAVEQALENPNASQEEGQPPAEPNGTVVTLSVAPSVAQAIFLAEEDGTIRLSVRAPGDHTVEVLPGTAFFSVLDQIGPVQLVASGDLVDLLGS